MVITMAWATLHIGEAMDHLDRFAGDTYVFTAPVAEDRYTLRIGESFIVIQPSKRRSCIVFSCGRSEAHRRRVPCSRRRRPERDCKTSGS